MEHIRTLRLNTNINDVEHTQYPYDTQYPTIELLSRQNSKSLVELNTKTWNRMNELDDSATDDEAEIVIDDYSTMANVYFGDNSEWNFLGYQYQITTIEDTVARNEFSELGK